MLPSHTLLLNSSLPTGYAPAVHGVVVVGKAVAAIARFAKTVAWIAGVVIAGAALAANSNAEAAKQSWYQVDVIILAPVKPDTGGETLLEDQIEFPANILAITGSEGPQPFKLSHLRDMPNLNQDDLTPDPVEPTDAFSFQQESQSSQHRRLMQLRFGDPDKSPLAIDEIKKPFTEDQESESGTSNEQAGGGNYQGSPVEAQALAALELDAILAEVSNLDQLKPFKPGKASTLSDIANRLRRSSRFRLLAHHSWIQPISSKPTPVLIQAGNRHDDLHEVEGTLTFFSSRYLHVEASLWHTRFEPSSEGRDKSLAMASGAMALDALATDALATDLRENLLNEHQDLLDIEYSRGQLAPAASHRMLQSRRLRTNQLHYLDHPLLGVIVRVNRYDQGLAK